MTSPSHVHQRHQADHVAQVDALCRRVIATVHGAAFWQGRRRGVGHLVEQASLL